MFDLIDRVNHHAKALQDAADRIHLERDLAVPAREDAVATVAVAPVARQVPSPDCQPKPARGTQAA